MKNYSGYETNEQLSYDLMVDIIDTYLLSGEDVLRLLTAYHGMQLMSDDFMDNLIRVEGYDIMNESWDNDDPDDYTTNDEIDKMYTF